MLELAKYQNREGVFAKQFVRDAAKDMAPAKWWNQYGKGIPTLS